MDLYKFELANLEHRVDTAVAALTSSVASKETALGARITANTALIGKVQSGNYAFSVSPATASPTVAQVTANAMAYTVTVSLVDGDGAVYTGYNGKVLLAIADNDDNFSATISPAAGEHAMTNGVLTVVVTLGKGAWTAWKKATLTASDPATAGTGVNGWAVADATFVATIQA